ncbi:MAG: hypothetical protein KatS3mg037_0234 [Ignavibacterium sp.]|nr:MAG: hypothetical protein KatS3mg037_0234 [Ignavibacterium sp.]
MIMKTKNKNIDLILRYFDGELNDVEKENLFNEFKKNEDLRIEFDSIKNIFDLKSDVQKTKVNQEYLDSIVPKFRTKLEKGNERKSFNPIFASALTVVLIAIAVLLLIPKESKIVTNNFSDISDEELIRHLSQDYSDLIQEEKIDSLLNAELKTAPDKISYYVFNGDDITNLYKKNLINPEDENEIYSELIAKKF